MEIGKTNLFTIASDIRYFILTGLETLPLTIAGTFLVIGLFVGNYAMLFFLVGYLLLVPSVAFGVNTVNSIVRSWAKWPKEFSWGGKDMDACNVVTGFGTSGIGRDKYDMAVSYWMAMVGFFIGYIFTNAWSLYEKPSASGTDSDPKIASGVTLRQSQSITAMVLILILAVSVLYMRLFYSSCDSWMSLILCGGFAGLGWWWYTLLSSIGEDRLSDLFGIANRLMTPSALVNAPYACLPQA